MASRPGLLTEWPWTPLGSFKYLVLAPLVIDSIYSYATMRDVDKLLILVVMVGRVVHSQMWISFARYKTAKGTKRIVNKSIEFNQVDRERTWDDQVIFNTLVIYLAKVYVLGTNTLPFWRLDGVVQVALLHAGPVEFIYYWFHRALHHHFLYSRYHSHHHSSIVTEPITSVVHPFAEHIGYTLILGIPLVTTLLCGTVSAASVTLYITYIDFMNNLGHCNFELIPRSFFSLFPPIKYLCYTPSFHSLHHTQFRTNYSLFMPMYDYIYGTNDKCSDSLYESLLEQEEEKPEAIHLTHLTSLDSIYHLRLGFASFSSHPLSSRFYLVLMKPISLIISFVLTSFSSRTFVFERNRFGDLTLHSHLLPKFSSHYKSQQQKESINKLIETAILEAEKKDVRGEELNGYGEMYVRKYPKLKIKIVDGTSLAAAVVVHSIPAGTREVLFRGQITKVARAIVISLCQSGIKVMVLHKEEHCMLARFIGGDCKENLVLTTNDYPMNWLGRRVMSAWRVGGIVHALEGWEEHECGLEVPMVNPPRVWEAALRNGFKPLRWVEDDLRDNILCLSFKWTDTASL
ncbi:hypothetical protein YC2023_036278 [Brassica napus]